MAKRNSLSEFEDLLFIWDSDRKISLDLRFPSYDEAPSCPAPLLDPVANAPERGTMRRNIWRNCRPVGLALTAWVVSLLFTIVYSLFIYHVLFLGNPVVGSWVFEASLTNLLLSILSQLYAMLLAYVALSLSDALRWSLAARSEGQRGASASSFFQLSPATDWFSLLKFIFGGKVSELSLPFMGLGFGSVLKFQNSFEDYFIKQGASIDVYAGNIPPDVSVLELISTTYLDGFFDTWTQQLLNYPRYATDWTMKGCTNDCSGGLFNTTESIIIENAPGLVARFEPVPKGFVFDTSQDCNVYQTPLGDALQMCKKQMGDSVAAGWRACPSFYQFTRACATQLSWTRTPLVSKTLFSAYRQNATTTYSQKDLSIQHVEAVSKPFPIDLESINVTISRMAWKYRTYTEFFPDNQMQVELLQNFLSVPLQFAVTALQYANYTLGLPDEKRTFPPELLTTATGGRSIKRFVSQPWTVWVFIGAGTAVVALTGAGFWWILAQAYPLPKPSGIVELDFISRISDLQRRGSQREERDPEFSELVQDIRSQRQHSAWQIIKALRERRLGLVPEDGVGTDAQASHQPVLHLAAKETRDSKSRDCSSAGSDMEKGAQSDTSGIV